VPFSSHATCDNFAEHFRDPKRWVAENPPISLSYDRVSADIDDAMGEKKPVIEASYDLSGPVVVRPLNSYPGSVGNGIGHAVPLNL
jgi:hypothetical protein